MQMAFVSPEEVFVDSARYVGLSKITEAMLKARVINNIEVQDGQGNTALIAASTGNNIDLVQLLARQHADVNAQNSSGERALSFFILNGNHKAITMLLNAGAEVNYVDIEGSSPLSLAVFRQDKFVVDQLLRHGASMQPVIALAKRLGIKNVEKLVANLQPTSI
jgi:ankyrin repeat protein